MKYKEEQWLWLNVTAVRITISCDIAEDLDFNREEILKQCKYVKEI